MIQQVTSSGSGGAVPRVKFVSPHRVVHLGLASLRRRNPEGIVQRSGGEMRPVDADALEEIHHVVPVVGAG